ncbi:MAG: FecR family protein [Flavitalea sp.]
MQQRINFFFDRYVKREISPDEFDELLIWLHDLNEEETRLFSAPLKELWEQAKAGQLPSTAHQVNWERVFQQAINNESAPVISIEKNKPGNVWLKISAAAVLILSLSAGGYWFLANKKTSQQQVVKVSPDIRLPETVLPGNKTATLTLSNGSKILLNDAANGTLAQQGGAKVIKLDSGQLMYKADNASEVVYNLISTPRAAEYQIILPDGSKVWLNASSSLRFPTSFKEKDRRVELTGEGYFEVAKNQGKPFKVKIMRPSEEEGGDMEVEALGTHFNIMAYNNEDAIKTTLLEGAVKVSQGSSSSFLQPGKQALLNRASGNIRVLPTNVNIAVAWKNGYFYFEKADVKTILRQVGRWYDLDIVYAQTPPDLIFSGKIERNLPLSGILRLLQHSKIHFRIEGKKLTVLS